MANNYIYYYLLIYFITLPMIPMQQALPLFQLLKQKNFRTPVTVEEERLHKTFTSHEDQDTNAHAHARNDFHITLHKYLHCFKNKIQRAVLM